MGFVFTHPTVDGISTKTAFMTPPKKVKKNRAQVFTAIVSRKELAIFASG